MNILNNNTKKPLRLAKSKSKHPLTFSTRKPSSNKPTFKKSLIPKAETDKINSWRITHRLGLKETKNLISKQKFARIIHSANKPKNKLKKKSKSKSKRTWKGKKVNKKKVNFKRYTKTRRERRIGRNKETSKLKENNKKYYDIIYDNRMKVGSQHQASLIKPLFQFTLFSKKTVLDLAVKHFSFEKSLFLNSFKHPKKAQPINIKNDSLQISESEPVILSDVDICPSVTRSNIESDIDAKFPLEVIKVPSQDQSFRNKNQLNCFFLKHKIRSRISSSSIGSCSDLKLTRSSNVNSIHFSGLYRNRFLLVDTSKTTTQNSLNCFSQFSGRLPVLSIHTN